MNEDTATESARKVWPEAEGFVRVPGGWTFRVGAGYAWITDAGHVSENPQGTRRHAHIWMSRGGE